MNRERELLERSVRIIESLGPDYEAYNLIDKIGELLAQPEQTPDYYLWFDEVHEEHPTNEGDDDVTPLYTAPPKREALSKAENFDAWIPSKATPCVHSFKAGVRFVEKAHGI